MITKIDFKPGDIVKVFEKIKEGEKVRTQVFEGTVVGIKGRSENISVRVRKLVGDIWVEKIWPIKSLNLEKIEIKERPKKRIRRAKLYNLFEVK